MKFWARAASISLAACLAAAFVVRAGSDAPEQPLAPDGDLRRTPLENFVLLSEFEITKEDLLEVRRHLANVRREVGRDFAYFPKGKIDVILSREETFRQYAAQPEQVKGFFDGRIHLPLPSSAKSEMSLKTVLWHEYTHAVVHELSRGSCPGWLHEGFARYEEARIEKPDIRVLAERLQRSPGLPIPLEGLETALAKLADDPETGLVVYGQAYGLVDYLFSRYSKQTIRDFVVELSHATPVEDAAYKVFHLSRKDLDRRWRAHLERLASR